MKTDDFDFELDESKIAQNPSLKRDNSKLLVMDKLTGEIKHDRFYNIIDYLNPGDVLVLNDTKVIPARLHGNRPGKDEHIEVLMLERKSDDIWETMVRPGKKMKIGTVVEFGGGQLKAEVKSITEDGLRHIEFKYDGIFEQILDNLGEMPLPPYIKEKPEDKNRYQTVYAREEGSAAAPTAGLHFTKELLEKIENKGVILAYLTLHVGLGTFRPVKVDDVKKHRMHSEYYKISQKTCDIINRARENGNRIIAVGTTSTRTLESAIEGKDKLEEESRYTDIFIYPGYRFKIVDAMITNFHLPKSTLIMLVSAFAGKENVMNAYKIAIADEYRFFSFGDSMLII
ncbi:MAG: tRNA preQ1(34) S-adenosylmethionine ribosyltransferase-isomerase QueA [Tissierellia bacterium]|nr:tRNA preQ1(34) S-adenosylmethionine ribosyltransferase-isomerase QueA [Tissierellia bacterium]